MKRTLLIVALGLLLTSSAFAQSIDPLSPFTSTSSPVSAITQRTYGKSLYITGLSDGCLYLLSGVLTSNNSNLSCTGGGGGGGSEVNWTFFNNSGLRLGTSTNQVLVSASGATATTSLAKLEVRFDSAANGSLLTTGSTTLQNFTFVNATGSQATTTSFFSTTGKFTNLTSTNTITGSITGNAGTASTLATGRTISVSGDLTYTSPSFDGSGNVTAAGTLATVNTNTGSFGGTNSIPNFTVNGKGLITAAGVNTPSIPASEITNGTFGTGDYTFPANLTITSQGTLANLLVTGSSTLQNFTGLNSTTTNATSTNLFTTTASSSNLFTANFQGAGLGTCTGASQALHWTGGLFSCLTLSGFASSTLLTDNNTFTGQNVISHALGSVGSPSITFNGDTNNGIYSAAADSIDFTTNGTWRGGFDPVGRFAVGTNTPQWLVQLATSTRPQLALSDPSTLTNNHWTFRNAGGNLYVATSSPTTFATSTTAALVIDANGIATFASDLIALGNATATNATTTNFFSTTASTSNLFMAKLSGAGLASCSGASNALTYVSATLTFGCNTISSSSGGNSKFATTTGTLNPNAISPNGGNNTLVGIGTSTPGFQLQSASTTGPQLGLTNTNGGTDAKHLIFDYTGSQLRVGTSSDTTLTSTSTALVLDVTTVASFNVGSTTPPSMVNGNAVFGSNGANGSTTMYMGKLQWDGYNSAGVRYCTFVNVAGALTTQTGACTQ